METFVGFVLWFNVFAAVVRILCLCIVDYPRESKMTQGQDFASTLMCIAVVVWAYHCLYI